MRYTPDKDMAKEMVNKVDQEKRSCGTKMSDLQKSTKECRDDMDDLNNNIEESTKRNLMIKSQATDNTNNGSQGE